MLGGPELIIIGILLIVASIMGILEGKQGGHLGRTIPRTCLRAFGRSFVTTSATAFLIFLLLAVVGFMGRTGPEAFAILFPALIISPILGVITSLLPAPIAAFIAYNFGARKRVEEELARNALPPSPRKPTTKN